MKNKKYAYYPFFHQAFVIISRYKTNKKTQNTKLKVLWVVEVWVQKKMRQFSQDCKLFKICIREKNPASELSKSGKKFFRRITGVRKNDRFFLNFCEFFENS